MATFTPDQYQRVWKNRIRSLRRVAKNSSEDAGRLMVASAKSMAPMGRPHPKFPKYTPGNLRKGIRWTRTKKGEVQVVSRVPGKFKYQFWVDNREPHETVKMVWNGRSATRYGDGSHHTTGMPGYWTKSTAKTRAFLLRSVKKNTKKSLRLGV